MKWVVPDDFNLVNRIVNTYNTDVLTQEEKNNIYNNILKLNYYKYINDIKLLMRYQLNMNIFTYLFNNYASKMRNKARINCNFYFHFYKKPLLQISSQAQLLADCYDYCVSIDNQNRVDNDIFTNNSSLLSVRLVLKCVFDNYDILKDKMGDKLIDSFNFNIYLITYNNTPSFSNLVIEYYDNGFKNTSCSLPLMSATKKFSNIILSSLNKRLDTISNQFLLYATVNDMIAKTQTMIEQFDTFFNEFIKEPLLYIAF